MASRCTDLLAKSPWQACLYSALPERSGAFCCSLVGQPIYFKSQVLVQGYKMGSKEWMWKNKSKWKHFEIYKIDFIYCRFSKTLNYCLKKSDKIRGHSWTSGKNENKWKKFKKFTARFFTYCGVRHPEVPKGVKALNFQFCPCFADHCDPRFHLVKNFSFIFIPFTCPAVASNFSYFFEQYSRFLKICE
jgi:hypothetical protein